MTDQETAELLKGVEFFQQRVNDRTYFIGLSGTRKAHPEDTLPKGYTIIQVDPEGAVFGPAKQVWVVDAEGRMLGDLPEDAAKTMPSFRSLGQAKRYAMVAVAVGDAEGRLGPTWQEQVREMVQQGFLDRASQEVLLPKILFKP